MCHRLSTLVDWFWAHRRSQLKSDQGQEPRIAENHQRCRYASQTISPDQSWGSAYGSWLWGSRPGGCWESSDCNNPKIHTPKIPTTKIFLQNPMWWWVTFVGANPKCCISRNLTKPTWLAQVSHPIPLNLFYHLAYIKLHYIQHGDLDFIWVYVLINKS